MSKSFWLFYRDLINSYQFYHTSIIFTKEAKGSCNLQSSESLWSSWKRSWWSMVMGSAAMYSSMPCFRARSASAVLNFWISNVFQFSLPFISRFKHPRELVNFVLFDTWSFFMPKTKQPLKMSNFFRGNKNQPPGITFVFQTHISSLKNLTKNLKGPYLEFELLSNLP